MKFVSDAKPFRPTSLSLTSRVAERVLQNPPNGSPMVLEDLQNLKTSKTPDVYINRNMPTRNSSGTYYPALPPSKRQSLLPNRKVSIKRKTRLPPLTKSQSTLTQLQFATPSSSRDVIDISSDDEYQEPRSSNKCRRSAKFGVRQPGQSSMTQFDRGEMGDFLAKRRKVCEPSSDDFDIWEDYEADKWEGDLKARQAEGVSAMPWLHREAGDAENDEDEPEIPETSQPLIEAFSVADRSAETALLQSPTFQTPKKVRFQAEVPSSQTPPSTKCSGNSAIRRKTVERSPLKERSSNASPVFDYDVKPESQNTSMWMLERVKFGSRNAPLKKRSSPMPSPEKIKSSQERIERPEEIYRTPHVRQLRKIETIRDSQVDDAGSMLELGASPVDLHHVNEEKAPPNKVRSSPRVIGGEPKMQNRPRPLCRASTIQDSQLDSSDALTLTKTNSSEMPPPLPAAAENQHWPSGDDAIQMADQTYGTETFDDYADDMLSQYDGLESTFDRSQFYNLQSTYDPAFSALDRDAARFKWTQTQAHIDHPEEGEDEDEIETESEDLDAGCEPRVNSRVERSTQNLASISGDDHDQTLAKAPSTQCSAGRLNATQDKDPSNNQIHVAQLEQEIVQVPSSPPPQDALPDPSQASTVVPTQFAQPQGISPHVQAPRHPQHETVAAPMFSVVSSPQKTCSAPVAMPLSSPLPLPPWSSPRDVSTAEGNKLRPENAPNSDTSLRSLADFSLPPPPPLSSGRSKR